MKKEMLRIENMRKGDFLKWINLQIFEGETIHIIFDSVQEKQSFVEIMTGKTQMDLGKLYYKEEYVLERDMEATLESKVAVLSWESQLIDSISIRENIFLMRPRVKENWVRNGEYKKMAEAILEEFQIEIDITKETRQLSPFEKVQIEMIKAYLQEKEIFILTDLNNSLSDIERGNLTRIIKELKARGISFIVSESLENLDFENSNRVMLVKHGRSVAVKEIRECDYITLHTILYQNVIKRPEEREFIISAPVKNTTVRLEGLTTHFLKEISITIEKGEIVKLFCIDERSYDEVTKILKGKSSVKKGKIVKADVNYDIRKNIQGIRDGIGVVDGNPVSDSLFPELSAMDNLQMLLSHKVNGIWARRKYRRSIRNQLKGIIDKRIYGKLIKELSNTDIQKIAYCRWLVYSPDLLICIQPFADGDSKARETARDMIYLLESRKIPVLIITSNSLEFNYCRGREIYLKDGELISKEDAYLFWDGNK